MSSARSRRSPRPPVVNRPHAPLTGEYAADPAVCHAYQVAVDFGLIAVDAVGEVLPHDEAVTLAKRMGFCDCGRLMLDDTDLTRRALSTVAAANMIACQGADPRPPRPLPSSLTGWVMPRQLRFRARRRAGPRTPARQYRR